MDDAEHLSAACLAVVDDLLDRRPPGVRLLLLSRWEVELSLVAAQLLGSLVVLRGDVLRVADDDARTLVRRHAPGCPDAVVERIVEQAAGWCATLVLAARAVDAAGFVLGAHAPGAGARVREFLEGSIAVRLSHHQHRPVLVVPLRVVDWHEHPLLPAP